MPEMKRCKQCGMLKDANAFRPYTYAKQNGTEGRFRICRNCESLNSTYKRLVKERQDKFWDPEMNHFSYSAQSRSLYESLTFEINKIEALYLALEAHGNTVPIKRADRKGDAFIRSGIGKVDDYVDKLNQFYGVAVDETPSEPTTFHSATVNATAPLDPEELDIPADLKRWLDTSIDDFVAAGFTPDYLQEVVYEALKAKYRPQIGTDPVTMLPMYDDTYKTVLNEILRKFDDYEDQYAMQEENSNE